MYFAVSLDAVFSAWSSLFQLIAAGITDEKAVSFLQSIMLSHSPFSNKIFVKLIANDAFVPFLQHKVWLPVFEGEWTQLPAQK